MNQALLIAELRRDEGVRYRPYLDTATPPRRTVGVGHNMDAKPLPSGWVFPLSDAQVNQLLASDLQAVYSGLDAKLPWWRTLDEVRQRVVANMAFNLGVGGLLGFPNTLAVMRLSNYASAAAHMKASAWYKQVGQRAVRLCQAMETGVMPS
ncbi:glycoside hydrolase family protein [Paludibacterium denitrificans]|nr:glycoside hydrolase family protein [Paludibacterium denitrificans]